VWGNAPSVGVGADALFLLQVRVSMGPPQLTRRSMAASAAGTPPSLNRSSMQAALAAVKGQGMHKAPQHRGPPDLSRQSQVGLRASTLRCWVRVRRPA
jgi:hypothetical protein